MYPKFCEGKVPLKQMVRSLSPMEENQRFCLSPVQGDSLGSTLYFGSFFKIAIKVVRTPRLSWVHTPCGECRSLMRHPMVVSVASEVVALVVWAVLEA